jgi:single-strand DNA-binding protein
MANKVILVGRVGQDAKVSLTPGGAAVANWSMATSERYKDAKGEQVEKTEWHSCQLWGKRGEALGRHITKGKLVYVEGSLTTRSWEKDGVKHYKTEVNVREFEFCGDKRASDAGSPDDSSDWDRADVLPSAYGDRKVQSPTEDIPF